MRQRDAGSATVEFVGLVIAMLVPLAYAIVAMAQLQSAVFAVEGAAQMAARAYVQGSSDTMGRYAAARSAAIAGRNHGLIITMDNVSITCDAGNCLMPGTSVRVTVHTTARIGAAGFTRTMPLSSSRTVVVDPYRVVPQ